MSQPNVLHPFSGRIIRTGAIASFGGLLSGLSLRRSEGRLVPVLSDHGENATLHDPKKFPGGFPVFPGVNRQTDGKAIWDGQLFDCNAVEGERLDHLLHFHRWCEMEITSADSTGICMTALKDQQLKRFRWPGGNYRVTVSYKVAEPSDAERSLKDLSLAGAPVTVLDAEVLDVQIELSLAEDVPTPLQALWHMMALRQVDGDDNLLVQFGAEGHFPLDKDCLPKGYRASLPAELNYSQLRRFELGLDHCVYGWDGVATMLWPQAKTALRLFDMKRNCPCLQVWNGADFDVCALEGQPSVADLLNQHEQLGLPLSVYDKAGTGFSLHHRLVFYILA